MKEYLFKNSIGEYKQVDQELLTLLLPLKHWVEIPEGADVAVEVNESLYFYNEQGDKTFFTDKGVWVKCDKSVYLSGEDYEFLTLQSFLDCKGTSLVWEREKQQKAITSEEDYLLTKTPFTYNCLLGCYVEPYVGCSNGGYIVSVSRSTVGDLAFEVEGKEIYYGILAKDVIFYTDDNQPLTFEQYKEMYYGATYSEETSNEVTK